MKSPAFTPAAEDQAALWAARLDGSTLSAADRQSLDAWLAENPAHRTLLSSYCQFSADLETQLPALVAAGTVAMPAPKKAPRRNVLWFPSLALAAAAAVMFTVWFQNPDRGFETVASPTAQRQSVTLSDGTRVELNARTTLRVAMSATARRVRLSEGEAFFTVAKDQARPFTVETPTGSVRVTGTVFNVRAATASALDVTVVEGSVQVRPDLTGTHAPAEPVALTAGDHLHASVTAGLSRENLSAGDLDDALAWREGRIVLNGTPLGEALARFSHYHGRTLTPTPAAAATRITGRPSLDQLDEFLTSLEEDGTLHLRVARSAAGQVNISLSSER